MNLRKMATALMVAMAAGAAMAVPAKRDVIHKVAQPDGTVVELTRLGDEYSHIYLTTDRVPVMVDAQGRYCYATLSADGSVKACSLQATNPEMRSAAEQQFVVSIDKEAVAERMLSRRSAQRANQAPQRANQSSNIGLYDALFPHTGDVHALVILVQFSDVKFKVTNPHDYFTDFLNKEGFSADRATGSVRDYFVTSSMGQFTPTFDLFGPVTLPNNCAYYGANDTFGTDKRPGHMVFDACQLLDSEINFADYDLNNDGNVDNVYIIYAGQGEASYGSENTIWPHRWTMQDAYGSIPMFDNKGVNDYGCCNEWEDTTVDGIGTFCHEFSHVMGLPDLYYTGSSYSSPLNYVTPGSWSVLDYGPYNNDGRTPPVYSAFERNAMGWIDPIVLKKAANITLRDLEDSNDVAIVLTDNKNEFYLFENRQQTGWDTYLPGHGMLVWHVNYDAAAWRDNGPNNNQKQCVDIVEASGLSDNSDWETMGTYTFPGTTNTTSFTDDTTPSMRTWAGKALGVPLTEIAETDGVITFDVNGGNVELSAPQPVVADILGNGFTLTWPAVDKAKEYVVNVFTKDDDGNQQPLSDYTDYSVEDTTVTVTRLQPQTRYFATVQAKRGGNVSEASDELEIVTGEATFDMLVPVVAPATEVTAERFVANWNAVEGASSYILNVNAKTNETPVTETVGFGSGNSFSIPTGWTSTSSEYYKTSSNGYHGPETGAPSLKLKNKGGDYIQSPVYEGNVTSFDAWVRSASGVAINYVEILGLTATSVEAAGDSDWTVLYTKSDITTDVAGELISLSVIPTGVHAIRLVFYKMGNGNLAVDDIHISVGGESEEALDGYTDLNVGNVTSYAIDVPQGVTCLSYSVTAVNAAGVKSEVSDLMEVKIGAAAIDIEAAGNDVKVVGETIVVTTAAESTPVVVADLAGRVIATAIGSTTAHVAPGFYVVRVGAASCKVSVR